MKKNYWNNGFKTAGYYFYSAEQGYECRCNEKGVLDVYHPMPRADRKSVRERFALAKKIAQASTDGNMYEELRGRCYGYIREQVLEHNMTGDNLVQFIRNTPTDQQVTNQARYDYGI